MCVCGVCVCVGVCGWVSVCGWVYGVCVCVWCLFGVCVCVCGVCVVCGLCVCVCGGGGLVVVGWVWVNLDSSNWRKNRNWGNTEQGNKKRYLLQ